jgi:hypothetical protein
MGVNIFDEALFKALDERLKLKHETELLSTEPKTDNNTNSMYTGISFEIPDDIRQKMVFDDDDYNLLSKVYGYNKYLKYIQEYNYGIVSKNDKIMNFDKSLQNIYSIFYQDKHSFIYRENDRYVPNLKYENKSYDIPMDYEYSFDYTHTIIKFKYKGKDYNFMFEDKLIPHFSGWISTHGSTGYSDCPSYYKSVPVHEFIKKMHSYYNKLLNTVIIANPTSLYDWIMKCEEGDNNGIC